MNTEMNDDVGSGNPMSKEIWVNEFNQKSAQLFREQVMMRADADGRNVIPIYIDSYGGYVDSLAKMIETMDEVPNHFVTVCMGTAMSCGAILLSHGDLRFCGKYSRIMIHNVLSGEFGDVTALKANANETERLNKMFLGLLAKNSGITYEKLQELIKASTDSKDLYLGAEEALKFGIVDKIGVPNLIPHIQWSCEPFPLKQRLNHKTDKKTTKKKKKR
jgi:ATP-dependent Clp protease, protease subunit